MPVNLTHAEMFAPSHNLSMKPSISKIIVLAATVLSTLLAPQWTATGIAQTSQECFDCHADPDLVKDDPGGKEISMYVDEKSYEASVHSRLQCVLCHSDILDLPHSEEGLRTVRCSSCHLEEATQFLDSIHQRSLRRGDVFAPDCKDCHGKHAILSHKDPNSRTFRGNVLNVCGACHEGIREQYEKSYHGWLVAGGNKKAPTCYDCHYSHRIMLVEGKPYRIGVVNQCGHCHKKYYETFSDTFHGKMTALGEVIGAKCFDCHGSHNIFPVRDIRSTIHKQNLLNTCRKCHQDAPENLITYITHADIHSPRFPVLYYTNIAMVALLIGTFSFFGIHSILWLNRLTVDWASRYFFRKRK
ncbi:MAG: hypothetical protein JRG73_18150 [Deltaproteobacteria bacterium]|nr:hypothetical protein [Deltaproteobacteria bacterium]MBW2308849.1 hypothetical protein [Deltaproteobacteria bacterium]